MVEEMTTATNVPNAEEEEEEVGPAVKEEQPPPRLIITKMVSFQFLPWIVFRRHRVIDDFPQDVTKPIVMI